MTAETCPHSGADALEYDFNSVTYACGTVFDTDLALTFLRRDDCYERHISQIQAEVRMLQKELHEARGGRCPSLMATGAQPRT